MVPSKDRKFGERLLSERSLKDLDPSFSEAIDIALDGRELSVENLERLLSARGPEVHVLSSAADLLREEQVGDVVTFVVNRNINFTNECMVQCGFCAFSRPSGHPEAYTLSIEEIARKAKEARGMGATEVCVQGAINPRLGPDYYISILEEIKRRAPGIHIHAFSPEEIDYFTRSSGQDVEEALKTLREAGLDSIPGTAAEILDDDVRRVIAPRKIGTARWIEIVKTAHKLGIPTTSTIMYGHVEELKHKARHMAIIREIQKETGGFTEFVLLPFVHRNTRIYRSGLARPGPTGVENVITHAAARLFLGRYIRNIQTSWPKLGPATAQIMLYAGANDLGGTLMEENISRAAGAQYGEGLSIEELVRLIRDAGMRPAQRTTTYGIIRIY